MLSFLVLGIKPKALHMLGKHSTDELYPHPTFFDIAYFDILPPNSMPDTYYATKIIC
jgi:hypothetical protein